MHGSLPAVWRNLILLYLGLFLTMSAWGVTGSMLNRRSKPVSVPAKDAASNTVTDQLGLWIPGSSLWRRMLQMAIPGLNQPREGVMPM